ncbi:hypothetical protein EYF80_045016 [Liparis tanakae]|uniref:Uncharacterized protein n=1 Tax=Liparis tanakae TaxID=230148 RepID=A0A4Z2FU17_9TELE|nr:hypothetical protein EYF80_045016 [Liparis tanakae]
MLWSQAWASAAEDGVSSAVGDALGMRHIPPPQHLREVVPLLIMGCPPVCSPHWMQNPAFFVFLRRRPLNLGPDGADDREETASQTD